MTRTIFADDSLIISVTSLAADRSGNTHIPRSLLIPLHHTVGRFNSIIENRRSTGSAHSYWSNYHQVRFNRRGHTIMLNGSFCLAAQSRAKTRSSVTDAHPDQLIPLIRTFPVCQFTPRLQTINTGSSFFRNKRSEESIQSSRTDDQLGLL